MHSHSTVAVWDPLIRLFHWSLVTAYAVAWLTADDWAGLHELAGYTVGGLLLFRIAWGLVGSRHARFGDFVRPPREVIGYLADVVRLRARRYLGHNPAGGAMIVALLLTLSLTVISGVLALGTEDFSGPAGGLALAIGHDGAEWLEELHELFATLTLLLVGGHLAGVAISSLLHRENLVIAMVTGRKPNDDADH